MKKYFKKVLGLVLSAILTLGAISAIGCGKRIENVTDDSKTQLFVGLIEDGYGRAWLDSVIEKFEAKYENFQLNGKTGVQIVVDPLTDYGLNLQSKLKSIRSQVIFDGEMVYNDYVAKGDMVDITDTVQGKLTQFGENESIEDKMDESSRNTFKVNGKYYALPYAFSNFGITYNKDMFNDNNFYFAAQDPDNGNYAAKRDGGVYVFVDRNNKVKSAGPNGKTGVINGVDYSIDDGLPATFEQFFALCNRIKGVQGYIPIFWAGKYQNYVNEFLSALWANIEGKDEMELNYSMNGTAHDLVEVADNGTVTKIGDKTITEKNGYELYKQQGRYFALKFLEEIVKDNECYFENDNSHTQSQNYFIRSGISAGYKNIAMFIEGMYWENEARATFASMAKDNPSLSRENRNFGWMPFPKISEDEIGSSNTIVPSTALLMFLNPHKLTDDSLIKLAKEFIQFFHTRENLADFTVKTSLSKPYFKYELTESERSAMSNLGREIYDYCNNAEMVNVLPCKVVSANFTTFGFTQRNLWYSAGLTNSFAVDELKKESVTARSYFEGIYRYYSSTWKNIYEAAYGSGSFNV